MTTILSDGRWPFVLRMVNALAQAGFVTKTDTRGQGGVYSIAVDAREVIAARQALRAAILQRMEVS